MSLGQNIKALRESKGWSTHRLAEEAGTHQSSVWRFEADEVRPRTKTLIKLAKALGTDARFLEYGDFEHHVPLANKRRIVCFDLAQVGWEPNAETLQNAQLSEDGYVWTRLDCSAMAFAIRFRGDSMLPEFRDGDRVVVDPKFKARPGDFVVARAAGDSGETVLRQYAVVRSSGGQDDVVELRPLSSLYPIWSSLDQNFRVLGVAVEVTRGIYPTK